MALFPEHHSVAINNEDVVQIRLKDVELHRPRQWGACWLSCRLYKQLGWTSFGWNDYRQVVEDDKRKVRL